MTIELATIARQVWIENARTMRYADYLQSPWWQHARTQAIKRARGVCELCREADASEVHHTTYERLGHEHRDDLVALCRRCHQHITDNGLDRTPRRELLRRRREVLHSPEFGRTWGKL